MEDDFITRNDRFPRRGKKGQKNKCPNTIEEWEIPEDEEDDEDDEDDEDNRDNSDDSDDSSDDDKSDEEERHTCDYAHQRVIDGPADFHEHHMANKKYEDESFPVEHRIRWNDMPHMVAPGLSEQEGRATWLRV